MARTYRIMGVPFADRRELMVDFARVTEGAQAGVVPQLEKRAADILLLGEMVGVSSAAGSILPMLSDRAREVFEPILPRVRPGGPRRTAARLAGRLLMRQAVGKPRNLPSAR
jgi:hypothetical protein